MSVKKKAIKKAAPKKKRVVKKRVGTSTDKPSMITKRAPSKRLKARRRKNTESGYYPNPMTKPISRFRVIVEVMGKRGYWTGSKWDTDGGKALLFGTLAEARKAAQEFANKYAGKNRKFGIEEIKISFPKR